jgi:hypothetical protein
MSKKDLATDAAPNATDAAPNATDAAPNATDAAPTVPEMAPVSKTTRIMIPSHSGPSGSDDVFVSVNGRDYLIKRDEPVDAPEAVIGALKNAVVTDYVTDAEGLIVRERQVPRFPFQVL